MTIAVIGAGAFGTALAIALAAENDVWLWGRDAAAMDDMAKTRESHARLPGFALPPRLRPTGDLSALSNVGTVLFCVPTQMLGQFLAVHAPTLPIMCPVACCKGIDLQTGQGPTALLQGAYPDRDVGILTGPSFASDIAKGLPTALTVACRSAQTGKALQKQLSTQSLRLYRTQDVTGAEIGGALKNVIAIACGVADGAGLGASARAALMTRGFAELSRVALAMGAEEKTLSGLSGFGDLVLTCSSDQSRNFRYGQSLGAGRSFATATTVEGRSTVGAVLQLAKDNDLDLPVCSAVSALVTGETDVRSVMSALLARPLKEE